MIPVWIHGQENSITPFLTLSGVEIQFRADTFHKGSEWIPTVEAWGRDGKLLYYRKCLPSWSPESALVYAMMFIKNILMNHHGWLVRGLTDFV